MSQDNKSKLWRYSQLGPKFYGRLKFINFERNANLVKFVMEMC